MKGTKSTFVLAVVLILTAAVSAFTATAAPLPRITVSSEYIITEEKPEVVAGFGIKLPGEVTWDLSLGGQMAGGILTPFASAQISRLQALGFLGYVKTHGSLIAQWETDLGFGVAAGVEGVFGNTAGEAGIYYLGAASRHLATAYGFPASVRSGWGVIAKGKYRMGTSNTTWVSLTRWQKHQGESSFTTTTGPEFTLGGWQLTGQAGIQRSPSGIVPAFHLELNKGVLSLTADAFSIKEGSWYGELDSKVELTETLTLGGHLSDESRLFFRLGF